MKRPTIGDVARGVGLSKTTISKVMNVPAGEIDVPEATRLRVLEYAAKVGYRPSWRARAFANRRTHTIGLLHRLQTEPQSRGDLWYDIVFSLSARFYDAGYDVQLVGTSPQPERWRNTLLDQRLDGCVVFNWLTEHVADALTESQLPVVLLNAEAKGKWTQIMPDERQGAIDLTTHLLELGHRRIAFMDDAEPVPHFSMMARFEGIKQCLKSARVSDKPLLVREAVAADGLKQILALPVHKRPTAIVTYNDVVALPLLQACWQAGIRIPQDLSIATFNDVSAVAQSIPPLTAVATPASEMAAQAVQMLLKQLESDEKPKAPARSRTIVPSHLVIRQSTGPVADPS